MIYGIIGIIVGLLAFVCGFYFIIISEMKDETDLQKAFGATFFAALSIAAGLIWPLSLGLVIIFGLCYILVRKFR